MSLYLLLRCLLRLEYVDKAFSRREFLRLCVGRCILPRGANLQFFHHPCPFEIFLVELDEVLVILLLTIEVVLFC